MVHRRFYIKPNPQLNTVTVHLFHNKQTNIFQQPPTWLVFVPVREGERQRGAIVGKPVVLSLLLLVHEADPVIHATVGRTLTQQTVDECLLEPASIKKRRGEVRREALMLPQNKTFNLFLRTSQHNTPLFTCFPQSGEEPCSNIPSVHLHSSAHGLSPCSRSGHVASSPATSTTENPLIKLHLCSVSNCSFYLYSTRQRRHQI